MGLDLGLLAVAGIGGAILVWWLTEHPPGPLTGPRHARRNYRSRDVLGTLGIVLASSVGWGVVVAAARGLMTDGALAVPIAIGGAGVIGGAVGLWDDLVASEEGGGFHGHLSALLHGRITSGLGKAVAIGTLGLVVAWTVGWRSWLVLVGGAVVALAANAINLLDLRPGRAGKVWLVAALGFAGLAPSLEVGLVVVATVGGLVVFLRIDLREVGMLGDGGANLLGATLGSAAIASLGRLGLIACLVALFVLTVLSEAVSFSAVIERVGPLRRLDAIGRAE